VPKESIVKLGKNLGRKGGIKIIPALIIKNPVGPREAGRRLEIVFNPSNDSLRQSGAKGKAFWGKHIIGPVPKLLVSPDGGILLAQGFRDGNGKPNGLAF